MRGWSGWSTYTLPGYTPANTAAHIGWLSVKCRKRRWISEARALEQLVVVESYLEDYKKASRHLKQLQKAAEPSAALDFIDGYVSYYDKDPKRAIDLFSKQSEEIIEAKRNLAIIHYNDGNYQEALDIWLEILADNPQDALALRNSGRAYYHLGQQAQGQAQFDKAGLQMKVEKYSPKTISLVMADLYKDIPFDFQCQVK